VGGKAGGKPEPGKGCKEKSSKKQNPIIRECKHAKNETPDLGRGEEKRKGDSRSQPDPKGWVEDQEQELSAKNMSKKNAFFQNPSKSNSGKNSKEVRGSNRN